SARSGPSTEPREHAAYERLRPGALGLRRQGEDGSVGRRLGRAFSRVGREWGLWREGRCGRRRLRRGGRAGRRGRLRRGRGRGARPLEDRRASGPRPFEVATDRGAHLLEMALLPHRLQLRRGSEKSYPNTAAPRLLRQAVPAPEGARAGEGAGSEGVAEQEVDDVVVPGVDDRERQREWVQGGGDRHGPAPARRPGEAGDEE